MKPLHPRVKILLQMIAIITAVLVGATSCSEHYHLGINAYKDAASSCISERFYIVKTKPPETLRKGQIVTFSMPEKLTDIYKPEDYPIHPTFLKFIRATAGDHIQVTQSEVLINGEIVGKRPLSESLIAHDFPHYTQSFDLTLEPGQVFVMGENDSSFDSRYWGPLRVDRIQGEVVYRFL
jgi:conjugal transfer pilin signal peptidase TrbI